MRSYITFWFKLQSTRFELLSGRVLSCTLGRKPYRCLWLTWGGSSGCSTCVGILKTLLNRSTFIEAHKLLKSGRSGEQYPFLLLLLMNDCSGVARSSGARGQISTSSSPSPFPAIFLAWNLGTHPFGGPWTLPTLPTALLRHWSDSSRLRQQTRDTCRTRVKSRPSVSNASKIINDISTDAGISLTLEDYE